MWSIRLNITHINIAQLCLSVDNLFFFRVQLKIVYIKWDLNAATSTLHIIKFSENLTKYTVKSSEKRWIILNLTVALPPFNKVFLKAVLCRCNKACFSFQQSFINRPWGTGQTHRAKTILNILKLLIQRVPQNVLPRKIIINKTVYCQTTSGPFACTGYGGVS